MIFAVHALNVMGEWAYAERRAAAPNGDKVDWRKTKFRRDFEADMFSGLVLALLRKQGGSWKVVELADRPDRRRLDRMAEAAQAAGGFVQRAVTRR